MSQFDRDVPTYWPERTADTERADIVRWLRAEVKRLYEAGQDRPAWFVLERKADEIENGVHALRRRTEQAERDAEDAEKGAAACDQIVALLDGIPVEAPCPEAARVAALLDEVERLRADAEAAPKPLENDPPKTPSGARLQFRT